MHPSTVRGWLRRRGLERGDREWLVTPDVAAEARAYYAVRISAPAVCVVDGCERPRAVLDGWCHMHWQRWRRTGSLERHEPGASQRAKTHCPNGHEYTPENTYVFADGRRRCRRCRLDAAKRRRGRAVDHDR